jgi:hypothetical protein
MDSVRKAILHISKTTDPYDPQDVKKAFRLICYLKKSLQDYEAFKNSLLLADDLD